MKQIVDKFQNNLKPEGKQILITGRYSKTGWVICTMYNVYFKI